MVEIKEMLLSIFPSAPIFELLINAGMVVAFFALVWFVTFAPIRAIKKEMKK